MHITALDRLTDPSYPIRLSEILDRTCSKNVNHRISLTNVINANKRRECESDSLQHGDVCQRW